ncbi:uncharacterized protein A4U43_C01F28900 [Asparagus officinalis]|uniref:Glycosyltransferase 61 catalytic domain-containing protein n=1 Tax=Asparagus officinalis TaxID=4686 RepID=A0A5P1FWR1_ASPOF|nr:uncharacterized protein LOC109829083 isoform X2 [Asparagus officinalis]ONK81420.1 uncharacterized protein A4U43_C01F28900 [Asparagus officinalis]
MKAKQSFGQTYTQRLGLVALFGCIIVPVIFIALIKSNSLQFSILSLQLSIRTYGSLSTMEEDEVSTRRGANSTTQSLQLRVVQERNDSIIGIDNELIKLALPSNEQPNVNKSNAEVVINKMPLDQNKKQDVNRLIVDIEMTNQPLAIENNKEAEVANISNDEKQEQIYSVSSFNSSDVHSIENEKIEVASNVNKTQDLKENQDENKIIVGNKQEDMTIDSSERPEQNHAIEVQESKLVCDFSQPRSDTCSLLGDIRILPKTSNIILVSLPPSQNSTVRIRPYARKWERPVMQNIKEVSISPPPDPDQAPSCSVKHTVPAVIFSTGGFLGNFFHDFTDVIVPLFTTSRHFQGEVQFLVTDFNSDWIARYRPILGQLSKYEVIDMDREASVHCFSKAQLGLLSHKVLGIDPSLTPNNYSMLDFKQFLRSSFSLNRESTKVMPKNSKRKPRLLMILRKGSRSLMNAKEIVSMARSTGFKVVTAGPEETRDLAKFAKIVNSCDVMMGVHGAGLGNMVFLPTNASLIQIIPWGGLKWACWHDFGQPAFGMGLNYVEYEIKEEESSLIEEYPRDHAVFKDPLSIHRQGWNQLWSIFLNKQKVKLDVGRFRGVLLEIYRSLKN